MKLLSILLPLLYSYVLAERQPNLPGQSLDSRLAPLSLSPRDLPIGTCNDQTPCSNQACCSKDGLCGYSPEFCGTGCKSNCNAKAQCGQYASEGQQKCPLNVCCSQYGYCGSTSDFCAWKGCDTKYGGCGDPPRPSCKGGASVSKRTIGYYESWSNTRKCQNVSPEDLNLIGFTHINFAFSFFDPSSFEISPMDANGGNLYSRFTGLKGKYNGLQTWISVGGWSFTDPGPTRSAFSEMASTSGNRKKFIDGLIKFMGTYGFDGVDLDWEYPAADDRGGAIQDTKNYVLLAQELKAAFGSKYGISMTLPTSYWYLQHFDLQSIQSHVDWFNLMAYDLHGTWDAASKFVGPYIEPHTNITEIDLGLDLLWRSGVSPDKVIMGEAWYGRSFTLEDPSCDIPNGVCKFSGPANAGACSNAAGILDDQEIEDVINKNNLKPVHDAKAAVKWITWDTNQWVSYDDDETFQQKRDFANSRCLGGLMVWAIDQKDQSTSNGLGPAPGVTKAQQSDAQQMSSDQVAGVTCYTTVCGDKCKKGTNSVSQMNGQPGQLSTSSRCPKGKYQTLCCDDGTTMGNCQWRGFKGVGLPCTSGCADDETQVVENTNHHEKKSDQTCNGGLQSYCCAGFEPAPSKAQLAQDAANAAKAAAEASAENAALDLAAKAFCRVAVPALLAPLELLEDVIPIIGEIADAIEIAATPAIIEGCIKGVEKEGKAEFKVFGKEHTLDINKPSELPKDTRPPAKTHEPPKTSSKPSEKPSHKPTQKPSKTDDSSSKTKTHSTSSATTSGYQEPHKCYKNICGENGCSAKRSLSGSGLSKRAFFSISTFKDFVNLENKASNQDISDFSTRNTGWIPFDGQNPRSVTVQGLEGCTVIVAISKKGMIVSHIFESGENKHGEADMVNTLNPDFADKTLAAVSLRLGKQVANVADGDLLIMLPMNPEKPTEYKYDTEPSDQYTKSGKLTGKEVLNDHQTQDIINMAQGATDLQARLCKYVPVNEEDTLKGTFAVQYDPTNRLAGDGVKQAYQIWCEGQAQFNPTIRW